MSYSPQNLTKVAGQANVGTFDYQPARGGKIAANQIQNTAWTKVYLAMSISDLVRRATAQEMEKSGIKLGGEDAPKVQGTVVTFKVDDLGFNVDWSYSINYRVHAKSQEQPIFDKTYNAPPRRTGKFGEAADYGPSVNEMILNGYEQFINDPEARMALNLK